MPIVLALIFVLCVALAFVWRVPARTSPITDERGAPVPGSIARLEKVHLGGVEQWILVRGNSTGNPVLLFLHGGPGTSEMGILRRYNVPALEKHFTVVIWDQRGAGKSYRANRPQSTMTVEQLIIDADELSTMLCRRFDQEKIFVAGHSWGSALAVLVAQRHPDLIHAVVGIGQVVNMSQGERVSYD